MECDAEAPRRFLRAAWTILTLATVACGAEPGAPPAPEPYDAEAHEERVGEWRAWRHEQLGRPDGWLSLAGLYWLEEGLVTLGGDPGADLVVGRPDTPAHLGTFDVRADRVDFAPAADVLVVVGGDPMSPGTVWRADSDEPAAEMHFGTLTWYVIERGGRLGVRLRDSDNPILADFAGMEYYPLAAAWRFEGRFEPYDPPRTIRIPNVLGTVSEEPSEGAAVFEVDGVEYRMDLWRDSDDPANFFTAFADTTNADTTYGGGRFLWIDAPDEHGRLVVDFNRSYNPPCAFTPYSTCPLPPPQNRLDLRIEAGERVFEP